MSDYTTTEIETAVENGIRFGEYTEEGWSELAHLGEGRTANLSLRDEEVEVEMVHSDTGGEGHGSDVSFVILVGSQLFEKTGYYASHYGTDWDGDLTEVRPRQKTITVYEAV